MGEGCHKDMVGHFHVSRNWSEFVGPATTTYTRTRAQCKYRDICLRHFALQSPVVLDKRGGNEPFPLNPPDPEALNPWGHYITLD